MRNGFGPTAAGQESRAGRRRLIHPARGFLLSSSALSGGVLRSLVVASGAAFVAVPAFAGNYAAGGGVNNIPLGNATAVGPGATTTGTSASAYGNNANANGTNATATGFGSLANGANATATGVSSVANGAAAATGSGAIADGPLATATGAGSKVDGYQASAYGAFSNALGSQAQGNRFRLTG